MKKIIFLIALLISAISVSAQMLNDSSTNNIVREGKTFTKQLTINKDTLYIKTEYKYKDAKNKEHNIWLTPRGNAFIRRISNKTGREYKQYLGEEISKEICKELGVAYKPKKKS